MIKYNIITLFPELISEHLEYLPYRKAIDLDLIEVNLINLRNYAVDDYGSVDDKPYGGGVGMLLRIEPIYNALNDLDLVQDGKLKAKGSSRGEVILLSPRGRKYTQKTAEKYSQIEEVTIICGRYEGVDARVEKLADHIVSIGDYILSGGELGALVIMESITRLLPGVLEKEEAVQIESFTQNDSFLQNRLEYPQYTRPEIFEGLAVPKVLLSGDHKKILEWRKKHSKDTTEGK